MYAYDALFAHLFGDYSWDRVWDMPAPVWQRRKKFADTWLDNKNQPWEG